MSKHDQENCHLRGGNGEVLITPYGDPDGKSDYFGCPMCIQADRDEAEAERDELLAALRRISYLPCPGKKSKEMSRIAVDAIAKVEGGAA